MDDRKLELWGSALLLAVTLMVAATVLFAQLSGAAATTGPWWLWWVCYLGFVGAATSTVWPTRAAWITPPRAMALAATLAAACVLLAPWGWTPILLVFTAAIAAHVVERRAVAVIVVANCLVLLAFPLGPAEVPWGEAVAFAAMYGVLQALSVWAVWLQLSEAEGRQRLAVVNTELRATTALLAETSRSAERLRISRDLHDVVGHHLTALALELEVAAHRASPPAQEHVDRARLLAKELLGEVRAAVGEMRDRPTDLAAALGQVVADLPRPRIHLDVTEGVEVDAERVGILVRCVQEIVTNTIRHADAHHLWVTVADDDGDVVLTAEDDGQGTAVLTLGNGLTGMQERVAQAGGTVTFRGRPSFGVEVTLPRPGWSRPEGPVPTAGAASSVRGPRGAAAAP